MAKALPFTNRVKELREAAGLTQADLAEAISMTRQTVLAIERGKYSPSLDAAFRIARKLGQPLTDVFVWREDEDTPQGTR